MVEYSRRNVLRIGGGVGLLVLGGATTVSADDHEDGAGLRVAHASPDAPAVDVYVNGSVAVGGLEFRSVTDYLELAEGEYEIKVNVAGTETTVFGPTTVELEGEDYTAVALGEVSSDDTEFTVSIFEDTNGANIGDDEARVRAIHASPDAPAVDVTVNDGALTLFDGFSFGESSGYVVVGAGTYEVEVRPDTEDNDGPVVSEADVTLEGGSTYTVFALGYLSPDDEPTDEAFELEPILDKSAPPRGDGEDERDEDDEDEDDEDEGDEDDEGGRGRGRGNDD